jgi:hypothetical protein
MTDANVMFFGLGMSLGGLAGLLVSHFIFPLCSVCKRRHPTRIETMTAIDMMRAFCGRFTC